jgi:hypothetical protein
MAGPRSDRRRRSAFPRGAVVDGTGKYLIPGLFEMHAHTSKTRASALVSMSHTATTIRDQGSEHAEVLRWRGDLRRRRVGPRLLIAGPYLNRLAISSACVAIRRSRASSR